SARIAAASGLPGLHRFQMREILRIGARDLTGKVPMRDITNELSWLADAVIQIVLEYARRELDEKYGPSEDQFAVIGVGKLGGEVASPLRTLQTYYDSWGETFERLALTKARVVAGNPELGERFIELITPFVYRKYLDFAAIDEVRDIKVRIDEQVQRSVGLERHVKLGRGGIREIEFFVQALQVLYGGEQRAIRTRSTLDALERLESTGTINREVAGQLSEAYVFLRNLEHKLQIVHHLQTHEIPADPLEVEKCARRMHMPLEEFQTALEKHR